MAASGIALARQVGRVSSSIVQLDPEEERRFNRLMEQIIMIDIHEHPMVLPESMTDFRDYLRTGQYEWATESLSAGGWTATATCNAFRGLVDRGDVSFIGFEAVVEEIGLMLSQLRSSRDQVSIFANAADIEQAKQQGRVGYLPTVEHLAIGNKIERVDVLYNLGIRIAGLTYSRANYIGDGQAEPRNAGLSLFGREVVQRMNELGMAIDVSHAGEQTALDAIEASQSPVAFTHNAAYSVWPSRRTRKDHELRACAEKGGLIGITAVPNSLSNDPGQDINVVLDHFDYMVKLVGVDHVAIGTDTVVGDHVGLHVAMLGKDAPSHNPPAPYLDALESPADGKNIIRGLVKRGYTDEQITKIAGGNALSFLRRVAG